MSYIVGCLVARMFVSVILSTYNEPAWLEKVVWGYAVQSHRDFELVIADDGSTWETKALLKRLQRQTGLTIRHVWHEDRGFRKCEILNRAIVASNAEYLVFSDGDCIPRRDFLATHVSYAVAGRFLSGGLVRLPRQLSKRVTRDDIVTGRSMQPTWLIRHGLPVNRKYLLLATAGPLAALLDSVTTTKPTWNGHNASGWKDDLLRVNGFDERMGYGGEDRELGERLTNAGVRGRQIRHRAICLHLDHSRGYVEADILKWNKEHRRTVRSESRVWTDYGIENTAVGLPASLPGADGEQRRRAA